jgi:hypothetical protein
MNLCQLPVGIYCPPRYHLASGSGDFRVVEYRAYTVGRDGHFVRYDPLVCADDPVAIAEAKRLLDGHDIELWSGDRLVVRLSHKPE